MAAVRSSSGTLPDAEEAKDLLAKNDERCGGMLLHWRGVAGAART